MTTENKMGVMPVNRLLVSMSVPMMLSMLVQALYNVVDSMFVDQISENALTAVSLAFPAQNLMIAVATGTGVGVNALLSRCLGEKNFDHVNKTANHALFLAICNFIVFAVLGLFFSRTFFLLQTDIPDIVEHGTSYLMICTVFSFGLFGEITCEKLLQSTGKTFYSMLTQGLGAILNIIFDPILIFGLFGFPKMGVAGAAAATVFGQIMAFFLGIYFNHAKNHEIKISFRGFRPRGFVIKNIYAVGVPSIIMASIGSVMTFGMNKILIAFTSTASAVFGVYFKLQSFIFMPVFGLNNGMVPIVAYNYGAAKPDRIIQTAGDFQRLRQHAGNRNPGSQNHQLQLPSGRLLHRLLFRLPGPCPRHVKPLDFRSETACGAASCGIHPFQGRRTFGHLVRVPDCRGLLRCYFIAVSAVRL